MNNFNSQIEAISQEIIALSKDSEQIKINEQIIEEIRAGYQCDQIDLDLATLEKNLLLYKRA